MTWTGIRAPKQTGNGGGSLPARLVAVEHEQRTIEMIAQEFGLAHRQCRSHKRDDGRTSGLVERDCVEKAFDDDHRARPVRGGSMQVKKDQRLAEAGWKSVLRLVAVDRAASLRDQLAGCVVDWDHDPPTQQPVPGVEAKAKRSDCLRRDAP